VQPQRTPAGGRLYANDDIVRLKLIKRLIDSGDSISNLAALSQQKLQERVSESCGSIELESSDQPLLIGLVGPAISSRMKQSLPASGTLQIKASYRNIQSLKAENRPIKVDILIIEQSTLHVETARQIVDLINQVSAMHAIVIYRFSARDALSHLPKARCSLVRAPIEITALQNLCLSLRAQSEVASGIIGGGRYEEVQNHAPPRRYDDETLARIAAHSPAIKCECPHHLTELLSSLAAFEKYSSECENRNQQDAQLHAYLSKATSHARHMIEDALERVLEIESIEI
jgi:DNA-binding transcriptional MerR regulator